MRLPDNVREEWRSAGVGDDLEEHYAAMEAAIGVTSAESERNGPNGKLAAGLDALGLPWQTIPRNVRDCGDCGPCAVGCRRGAKQSVLRTFLADACARGTEILDRSEVVRVNLDAGRAAGVTARVPGGEITVRAPQVALAGGSILSPVVLLRSGIATATAGRTLHMHPVAAIAGRVRRAARAVVRRTAERDERRLRGDRRPVGLPPRGGAHPPGADRAAGSRGGTAPTTARSWRSATAWRRSSPSSATATWGGSRSPATAACRSPTSRVPPERELLRRASVELAKVHRAAGARQIIPLVTPPHTWRDGQPFDPWLDTLGRRAVSANRILLFSAHQMSSCRIGTDPRSSVADPDGQVHGVPGVWVTDASAMPTASGVNPMLSLMALARRTATRMAAQRVRGPDRDRPSSGAHPPPSGW